MIKELVIELPPADVPDREPQLLQTYTYAAEFRRNVEHLYNCCQASANFTEARQCCHNVKLSICSLMSFTHPFRRFNRTLLTNLTTIYFLQKQNINTFIRASITR